MNEESLRPRTARLLGFPELSRNGSMFNRQTRQERQAEKAAARRNKPKAARGGGRP